MTIEEAKKLRAGDFIHHVSAKNADGTPMHARVTSVKWWKREPNDVEIRWKRGLREYGRIPTDALATVNVGRGC